MNKKKKKNDERIEMSDGNFERIFDGFIHPSLSANPSFFFWFFFLHPE